MVYLSEEQISIYDFQQLKYKSLSAFLTISYCFTSSDYTSKTSLCITLLTQTSAEFTHVTFLYAIESESAKTYRNAICNI